MAPRILDRLLLVLLASTLLGPIANSGHTRPDTTATTDPAVPAALPGAPPFSAALRQRLATELAARGADYEPRTEHRRADGSPVYTNRLLLEASPYLQQHAHNPVSWHPWGDAAFDLARRLDRPVLVSIGYSTCHWCHVMEEESFDDPETAALLNAHFVAIKVDREVRPDVDAIYMAAIHVMRQRGGWPLNVFVTPDREPIYAGTYFPPGDDPVDGRPGFRTVLRSLHKRWSETPERMREFGASMAARLRRDLSVAPAAATRVPGPQALRAAVAATADRFDARAGGVQGRNRFPSSLPVRLLLQVQRRSGDADARAMATLTLEKMAAGGIHDQLGGGFHRYTVDPAWRVPHFEKMLYDNALLALAYVAGWQASGGRADFAAVVRDTLDYLDRDMSAAAGGFTSATDADSASPTGERVEGWYFTWTPAEIRAALPPDQANAVILYWNVREGGPVEGRSVLHVTRPAAEVAGQLGIPVDELRRRIDAARATLLAARAERSPPLRDDKIITAWNGLAISAFATAGFALDEPRWIRRAARAAGFVLANLRRDDGRLLRIALGERAEGLAFLEDHAFLIAGLLDLYEAAGDPRWLREAMALQRSLDAHHADDVGGGYFQTANDAEKLIVREKPAEDGAVPAGNSVAARNLLRLHQLTGDAAYRERAVLLFSAFHDAIVENPTRLPELRIAIDAQLDTPKQIVVVHAGDRDGLERLLAPLRRAYVPNRFVLVAAEGAEIDAHAALVPVARGKRARNGRATAYVCENRVCELPTTDPAVFVRQLGQVRPLAVDSP